jgi:sulfide dehydrogenase cytochrome subunit
MPCLDQTLPRRRSGGAARWRRTLGGALALGAAVGAGAASAQDVSSEIARSLAATCANCHGTDGRAQGEMPALAGQPADRLLATLADFRDGRRSSTIMQQIVKGYREDQLRLIAGHFAGVKP